MAKQAQNMILFIIKRILLLIPMMLIVLTITFALSQAMLVNPVLNQLGFRLDSEVYEREIERMGYNRPWYEQYMDYLMNFIMGDWGTSYIVYKNQSVSEVMRILFPKTIELMLPQIILVPIIATKLGVISAANRNTAKDSVIRFIAFMGAGLPSFWIAGLLQYFIGITVKGLTFQEFDVDIAQSNSALIERPELKINPSLWETQILAISVFIFFLGLGIIFFGNNTRKKYDKQNEKKYSVYFLFLLGIVIAIFAIVQIVFYIGNYGTRFRIIDSIIFNKPLFLWDTIIHLILPTLSMILISLSGIIRQTRSSMLDVLNQDYIRTARSKGVPNNEVINKHAFRNALIPTSNLIIMGTAYSLLGTLFIEQIFNYKGFGHTIVTAIFVGDFVLINGCVIFASIIILIGTLVADVMYTIIDPRIIYK
ncbi:MAG: ABC transporter permease [Promethearchaeota archaeon]